MPPLLCTRALERGPRAVCPICPHRWLQERAAWREQLVQLAKHCGPDSKAMRQARQLLCEQDAVLRSFPCLPQHLKEAVFQVGGPMC